MAQEQALNQAHAESDALQKAARDERTKILKTAAAAHDTLAQELAALKEEMEDTAEAVQAFAGEDRLVVESEREVALQRLEAELLAAAEAAEEARYGCCRPGDDDDDDDWWKALSGLPDDE